MTKISIFGAGYVGFSLAVLLASKHQVKIIDVDLKKNDLINCKKSPIVDEGVSFFMERHNLNLEAGPYSKEWIETADFIILALPTNYSTKINAFDTSLLEEVLAKIAEIDREKPIIIKSTIPIGFTDKFSVKLGLTNCFYSPEFLREGRALHDNLYPSRIIVGSTSTSASDFAEIMLDASNDLNVTLIKTDNKTAETIKLASNAYLASRVAFFNELDSFGMKSDLDMKNLTKGLSEDSRIGYGYNNPSFAYGGYCLPKDVMQLCSSFIEQNVACPLISSISKSNNARLSLIVDQIIKDSPKVVGIFRMQMKKDSDNARESANLKIYEKLKAIGQQVIIFEPSIKTAQNWSKDTIESFDDFCTLSNLIVANRWHALLTRVEHKVFCRDIYHEN